MAARLDDKVAVITGGASGFGAAMAHLFTAQGARVVLGDLQADKGAAVAAAVGGDARFVPCNVTREEEVAALVDAAVDAHGRVDVMVNNAGIVGAVGPIDTLDTDEWSATLDVLLNGVFYGMKHAARVMKPRGSGAIVSLASTAGIMGGLGPHCYTAAKHAVVGLTKGVGAELCRFGIRVNAIAPAGMATPMVAGLAGDPNDIESAIARLASASPLVDRAGLATDVAQAALWLASDDSGYTNGHVLTTDAGMTTGATLEGPAFGEAQPMIREAGKRGL
ncbi:MAG: SDR family oxidoreductase [Pseudomonadota bacterium]